MYGLLQKTTPNNVQVAIRRVMDLIILVPHI